MFGYQGNLEIGQISEHKLIDNTSISWHLKKQNMVVISTTGVQYISTSEGVIMALWYRRFNT